MAGPRQRLVDGSSSEDSSFGQERSMRQSPDETDDSETDDSEDSEIDDQLARVKCSDCRRPLLRSGRLGAEDVEVCDGCHRCFHASCCQQSRIGIYPETTTSELWFHCEACRKLHQKLQDLSKAGSFELMKESKSDSDSSASRGYTMQVVSASRDASNQANNQEGDSDDEEQSHQRALDHVASVLADAYGPFVFQQVEGCDYGVLLQSQLAAAEASSSSNQGIMSRVSPEDRAMLENSHRAAGVVSAATLDVYGMDLAKVDLLATREDVRGQGHAKMLVSGLEGTLAGLGIRALVIVLDRSDREARDMWTKHFVGYKALNRRQAGALRDQFPHFQAYPSGSVFFRRQLADKSADPNNPSLGVDKPLGIFRRTFRVIRKIIPF